MLPVRPVMLAAALGLSQAPLQCSREADPDMRHHETPPEALYDLATRFKKQGDEAAWRTTLTYLAERYPNSRFAVRAKDELEGGEKAGDGRGD